MSHPYDLTNEINRLKKIKDNIMKEFDKQIDSLIKHPFTRKVEDNEFLEPRDYIKNKFPGVDLSDILIYISHPTAFDKCGFGNAYGVQIPSRNIIFLQNLQTGEDIYSSKKIGKFRHALVEKFKSNKVTEDDILVHELIHAVSSKTNRSTGKYTHAEEEFAYTNSVDYYRQKGMSDEQIINGTFLPFCCNDIINNVEEVLKLVEGLIECKKLSSNIVNLLQKVNNGLPVDPKNAQKKYYKFLNSHVDIMLPVVIESAQKEAQLMIDLYRKYGSSTVYAKTQVKPKRRIELDAEI